MGGICKKFESIRRYFMVQNLGREDTGEGNVGDPQTGGLGAVVWSCEKA
jgi:hypothetical protein